MKPLHIAFVITRADAVGGATVHVRDLSTALISLGHRATVLVGGTGSVTRELQSARIPFVSLRHLMRNVNALRDLLAVREIARAIRRIHPDLVSAHTAKAGCIARLACAGMGLPVLYTPHGWTIGDRLSRVQGFVYRQIERRAAPLSAAIVNVSRYERRLAITHRIGPPELHRVIHNGMPDIAPELRADPRVEPCRIVMVARFEEPKDHATLLQALAGLRHLPWHLELVGDGPRETSIRNLTESLGLAGRVHFRGAVPSAAAILAEAQIFALSSRSEGFPRSILEAMRAGVPVVASGVGGVAEAVRHGHNGYVVPRQSVVPMRQALESLIGDPFRRAGFGAAGRRDYEEKFTFGRMFAETLATYQQVMGAPETARVEQRRREWQLLR
jgi:glycosyltransferase involved in cell wall biosynthesis